MYCPNCGQENSDNQVICQRCGSLLKEEQTPLELEKEEKIPLGILGAILGALIGGLCIFLLYQADMVASISGIVLAFCTLKGYELLGGKLSKLGTVIGIILIVVTPFLAYLVSIGVALMGEWKQYIPDITLMQSIQAVFELMEMEPEMADAVVSDVLQLYLFTGIGVVAYFASKAKKKPKQEQ